jgi:mannosyltransferase OCH1-like enzyme
MQKIPKKIHFVWIGDSELTEKSICYINKFKKMYDDYEVKIWNDSDVLNENIIPESLIDYYFNTSLLPAFKADILRYLIINTHGGLYFDIDFEPLKKLPDCFLNFEFLGGIQNNGEVAIGFFAGSKHNRLLNEVINNIPQSIETAISNDYYRNEGIYRITGPQFFDKFASLYKKESDYFFFTEEYFYPYWFLEKERKDENFEQTSPLSYAVHHWDLSWKI